MCADSISDNKKSVKRRRKKSFVTFHMSPVACHMFGGAAAGGLMIDRVKKKRQFLFGQFKEEPFELEVSMPLQ